MFWSSNAFVRCYGLCHKHFVASALRSVFPPPVEYTRVDGGIAQNRQGRHYGCPLVRAEQDRSAWRALCGDDVSNHGLAILALSLS